MADEYVVVLTTLPADGEAVEGVASVDESAVTGESAPVVRESGGDRSAVTGGTTVVSDWIKVRVTSEAGSTFLDRMIAMVEGADRRKTPNEIALAVLLAGIDPEARVSCGGGMQFGGRFFHCHKRGGHGSQNLHEAIKNSCDTYFYSMSLRVGPDRIAQAARAFSCLVGMVLMPHPASATGISRSTAKRARRRRWAVTSVSRQFAALGRQASRFDRDAAGTRRLQGSPQATCAPTGCPEDRDRPTYRLRQRRRRLAMRPSTGSGTIFAPKTRSSLRPDMNRITRPSASCSSRSCLPRKCRRNLSRMPSTAR